MGKPREADRTKQCSCGAQIFFILTPNGKRHPVDFKPERLWVKRGETWELVPCYRSHFATCPQAERFRSRGRGEKQ